MGFKGLDINHEYRSFQDDIISDFYIPVLKKSIIYKRAVGYFSSSALLEVSQGIGRFVENGGKIKIIASPQLTEEDVKAINLGYKNRDKVISDSLLESLKYVPKDYFEKERLNLLAYLVEEKILDIKIAFLETKNGIGIYHEKTGILQDTQGNKIAFSGSLNETKTAFSYNYESIDVFCSWIGEENRVELKEKAFDDLWNNRMLKVRTLKFPKVVKEKLIEYHYKEPNFSIDEEEHTRKVEENNNSVSEEGPRLPTLDNFSLRPYQKEAIDNWAMNSYRGIFSMATGTGKTITALGAATRLFRDNKNRLAIIIVCPYQHLVEQWVEDIEFFGMNPIIGYSSSKQTDWQTHLRNSIDSFNYRIIEHFCFVTTNATFATKRIQDRLKRINSDLLIIIDEAHNFGAKYLSKTLLENAEYRLALSATIKRHNDDEGTRKLFKYFKKIAFEYTLEDAINNKMLTPYEYYPVPVSLTEEERQKYRILTHEIRKRSYRDKFGEIKFRESAKHFLIKRARLIAGAKNKLIALKKEISKRKHEDNILVYCGATTINDSDYIEGHPEEEEIRQIDAVTKMLGHDLGMAVAQFTSKENMEERENLKYRLANNDNLQVLVAIRCLDEGVNIPSVKTAYLLASSTNPKEYIQRRGRVLRTYKNKTKAIIYDFITLPVPLNDITNLSVNEIASYKGLINREVTRMEDFVKLSLNPAEADFLMFELKKHFDLWRDKDNEKTT